MEEKSVEETISQLVNETVDDMNIEDVRVSNNFRIGYDTIVSLELKKFKRLLAARFRELLDANT